MSFFKGAAKALVPKVELPRYFRITSTPLPAGALRIEATLHSKDAKVYSSQIPTSSPTLLDVVKAFPSIDTSKFGSMAEKALGFVVLPSRWELECNPAQTKEGFRISLDVHQSSGTKHWEKEITVTKLQLAELVDVLDWVKEANKIDRHGDRHGGR